MSNEATNKHLTEASGDKANPQTQPDRSKRKRTRYRSPARRMAWTVARVVALTYAGLVLVMLWMEPRLVYPGAYLADADSASMLDDPRVETVTYESADGVTLHGRLLEKRASDSIVLYFHGNGIKAKWMDDWLARLSDTFDATVMIAEYRGFDDDVTPTEKGVLADAFAARDYLCQRYECQPEDLIVYGCSLGGACATAVAAQGGAKALILERTFDQMVRVAANKYPFLPVGLLMRNRFDSLGRLTVYDGPLVIVHGNADRLIPIEHARRLRDAASCHPKHWIEVNGLGHNGSLPQSVLNQIVQRVRQSISDSPDDGMQVNQPLESIASE